MKNGFRLFDTHAHLGLARHSGRRQEAEGLLEEMDRHGVDRSMLLPFPVVEDYAAEHDKIAGAVRRWPARFAGAACLYPFVEEARFRDEVKRCAEELGFRAIKLQPQYQALNPVSRRCDFFYETALRHGMAVIVHTGSGAPFALPSLYILPARRFPELKIVLGHAGGSVYMLETIVAASVCPNIFIEVSSLMPHHVAEVAAHVASDRLMAGSDLPESMETEMHKILTMKLPDEAKADILWNTAVRVFGESAG